MHRGERDRYGGREKLDRVSALSLSQEELAEINARRSPSERIGETAICGARMSEKAIARRKAQGRDVSEPYCQLLAGHGTDHPGVGYCKWHGGNTKAGKKSAARTLGRSIIEQRKREMDRFGGDRTTLEITPEEALLEEVRRSVAMVRWLEERIGEWRLEGGAGGPDSSEPLGGLPQLMDETSRGNSTFTDEREWLLLYREERAHATKVSKMAIDAGIAHRMVSIAEDQGRILALAVKQVLDALNLSPQQASLVPTVVPQILRQVSKQQPSVIEASSVHN